MTPKERKGLIISLLGHIVVLGGLWLSTVWQPSPELPAHIPPMVQAVAIDNSEQNEARRQERAEAQREAEQKRREAEEAERKRREAEREAEQKARREAEQKKREEAERQARELAEREKAKAEAERKAREAEQKRAEEEVRREAERKAEEADRKKAEAEEKARKEAEAKRRAEEEAERQRQLELERLEQLKAERAEAERRERLRQLDIDRALYRQAIRDHVVRRWIKPPGGTESDRCTVRVTQSTGGYILDIQVAECTGNEAFRQSVRAAVEASDPLPSPENPAVFDRQIQFQFAASDA